jgi:hypothetical protein
MLCYIHSASTLKKAAGISTELWKRMGPPVHHAEKSSLGSRISHGRDDSSDCPSPLHFDVCQRMMVMEDNALAQTFDVILNVFRQRVENQAVLFTNWIVDRASVIAKFFGKPTNLAHL